MPEVKTLEPEHNLMQTIADWVDFGADIVTIALALSSLYLFITQRDKIKSAFDLLLSFSLRLTLAELFNKVEKLNDYNADEKQHAVMVRHQLKDICGQIKGNRFLRGKLTEQLQRIEEFSKTVKNINEADKRSLVSELRECLRDVDVSDYNKKDS